MSTLVKGAVLLGGAGAIATGSYFVVTSLSYAPVTLAEETNLSSEYDNKLGKHYAKFLVSPFNSHNRRFWYSSLERYKKDKSSNKTFSSDFQDTNDTKKAFAQKTDSSTGDNKALNRICEEIYKKSKTEIEGDSHKNLKSDFFTYCSILQENPQTIKEIGGGDNKTTYSDNQIGKTKEDKLLSVDVNEKTWELKNREFFKGSEPESAHKFFLELYKDKRSFLKDRCKEAYVKSNSTSSSTAPSEDEVIKYCTLLGN